ncbi:hypothetical protein ACTJKN_04390 [Pedobacter sp. 22163]|uniref:hypothetical protein n=1 Tax=Pedobacter sp. 22163 TaxID=3453883 RepID=UPI003F87B488
MEAQKARSIIILGAVKNPTAMQRKSFKDGSLKRKKNLRGRCDFPPFALWLKHNWPLTREAFFCVNLQQFKQLCRLCVKKALKIN